MAKTIVNNNIKLKSGGGLKNDATNGLSVDTGTTANKLVRLDASAKLPAVDGSNLTNLAQQTNFQFSSRLGLLSYTFSGSGNGNVPAAADDNGNLFIGTHTASSSYNALIIHRFKKDPVTGLYTKTHSVVSAAGGNGYWNNASITVMGDYVYAVGSSNTVVRRFDKADLANEVEMTLSGFTLISSYDKCVWNDGTFLYIYVNNAGESYPIKKVSVSGTTLTFVSSVESSGSQTTGGTWQDNTNFYIGSITAVKIINKATGIVTTSTDIIPLPQIEATVFGCNLRVGEKIVNISLNNAGSSSTYATPIFSLYSSTNF